MPLTSANNNLSKYIGARQTLQNVGAAAGGNVVSRYQIFNLSGFDYKGQLSCVYGISGAEGQVAVSVNLLEVLAPLLPLPIAQLEVTGNVGLQYEQQSLVALHRFPTRAYNGRVVRLGEHGIVHASQLPRVMAAREVFRTERPMTLLPFQGFGCEVSLSLQGYAGRRLAPAQFIDEAGFELALEVGASAGLRGYCKRFRAPYTGYFAAPSDADAEEAARLEQVVDSLLYRPDKSQLKAEVEAWLDTMVQYWLSTYGAPPAPQTVSRAPQTQSKRERARQKWREWVGKAKDAGARLPIARVTEGVESILNDYFLAAVNLELRVPALHRLLDDWLKTQRTSTLLDRLRILKKQVQASPAPTERKVEALRQARRYEELLLRFYRRLDPTAAPDPLQIHDYLSHFKTFSFAVGAKASANAVAAGQISLPEVPYASGLQLSLQGEASARAEGDVSAQFITYRYQAANTAGADTLVYTQDTQLTYRRWNASAGAMASAGFGAFEYERQTGAMKSHCAFVYTSTAMFWNYRVVFKTQSGLYTEPLNGSGVCRGMSVSTNRLIALAKNPDSQPRLASAINRRFGLDRSQLSAFLSAAQIGALDPRQPGLPANVILEVGFPFADRQLIPVQQKQSDGVPIYDVVGGVSDILSLRSAEWIRIRIRVADVDRSQDPIFKLGFPAILPRVSIDASRIRGAGQDALFDYYVHWLNNAEYNTNPRLAWWAQELSVPPVVFLHQ